MGNQYQAYYTHSYPIVSYMLNCLKVETNNIVLEPSAGDGVLIEALLNKHEDIVIDAYELHKEAVSLLTKKFASKNEVRILHEDTLTSRRLSKMVSNGGYYDRIIANPPYGAWQDLDRRKALKQSYSGFYVKETYSLFLYRCIQLLKDQGRLVFIIPDTFLNLHRHLELRKFILRSTKIQELILFPSSFFPEVNFGYSNLCIITLERCKSKADCLDNSFPIFSTLKSVEELTEFNKTNIQKQMCKQYEIIQNPDEALLVNDNPKVLEVIRNSTLRIGDIANCVTGFYSGNDKRFLKRSPELKSGKRYSKYEQVDMNLVRQKLKQSDLNGISDEACFIPIVKGGSVPYLKSNDWFMNWSVEAVDHYKKDKKARFQNSSYYFQDGIGVPMVSSKQITASLINGRLFDQSIVGIFPKEREMTFLLLAFFNSKTCNTIIRTINPTANNSANYIKKIPFLFQDCVASDEIVEMVQNILDDLSYKKAFNTSIQMKIDNLIASIYGF